MISLLSVEALVIYLKANRSKVLPSLGRHNVVGKSHHAYLLVKKRQHPLKIAPRM